MRAEKDIKGVQKIVFFFEIVTAMKRSMSYLSEEESDKESNVLDQMLERIQDKKYPPNNDIAKFKEKAAYDSFYVCLDFDAFFTSVEELYKPHLRTVPMVVSDSGRRTSFS